MAVVLKVSVPVVATSPAPDSVIVLVEVTFTPPVPELTVPVMLTGPVFVSVTLPVPPSGRVLG